MAHSRSHRRRPPRDIEAQRQAALHAIARERVLREALAVLDPQPDDVHLGYGELLDRLSTVLERERGHSVA